MWWVKTRASSLTRLGEMSLSEGTERLEKVNFFSESHVVDVSHLAVMQVQDLKVGIQATQQRLMHALPGGFHQGLHLVLCHKAAFDEHKRLACAGDLMEDDASHGIHIAGREWVCITAIIHQFVGPARPR
jgi:hypothetical protein